MSMITRLVSGASCALVLAACSPAEAPKTADASPAADKAADAASAAEAEKPAAAKGEGEEEEGCLHGSHPKGESCGTALAAPSEDGAYGAPIGEGPVTELASVLASAAELGEDAAQPVRVKGKVAKVCKKMGCWMVLEDGEAQARILMKDHSFTVPMDCDGQEAIVEGTLATKTFAAAQVKHLAKDAGEAVPEDAAPRKEFVLTAAGVRLQG